MVKVALISPFTLPDYCGNSILTDRLKRNLTQYGYQVALFNTQKDLPEQAKEFSPDIVHSFNAERTGAWMEKFQHQFSAPWVITLTGTDYASWCGEKEPPSLVRQSLENAGALIVFHNQIATSLASCLPQLKSKIHIIPQGVAVFKEKTDRNTIRCQYGLDQKDIVFLMVGGIRPVKNIPFAINAFQEIEKAFPKVILLHVGPVIDQAEADRVFYWGKNTSCFHWLGGLPHQEVRKLMRATDIFLNTSFHEGMSGAILEAMAEGLPILASRVGGNLALVQEGKNGFTFSPTDLPTLIKRGIELAQNFTLRKQMGRISQMLARKNHSEKQELWLHEQIYLKLLGGVCLTKKGK